MKNILLIIPFFILTVSCTHSHKFKENLPASGILVMDFGPMTLPYTGLKEFNEGVNIKMKPGTNLYAIENGLVESIKVENKIVIVETYETKNRKGKDEITILQIKHPCEAKTVYHFKGKTLVKEGDAIKRGQQIALSQKPVNNENDILHFQVFIKGTPRDPRDFLKKENKLCEFTKNY